MIEDLKKNDGSEHMVLLQQSEKNRNNSEFTKKCSDYGSEASNYVNGCCVYVLRSKPQNRLLTVVVS